MADSPRLRRAGALAFVGGVWGSFAVAALVLVQPCAGAPAGGCPPGEADPARLRAHVEALSALGGRDLLSGEHLARAVEYGRAELERAGGVVDLQPVEARGLAFQNVLARFGPEAGPRVVVSAHLDTCDALPGADDDGSGVAAVLELARLLGRHPPPTRVDLALYTLEEPPFFGTDRMGSVAHARALRAAGAEVKAMLSLDTLGFYADGPGSQQLPSPLLALVYPTRGDFIAVVGDLDNAGLVRRAKGAMAAAGDLPVWSMSAPRAVPGVDLSDHASFWDEGYPAATVTDTAFYRNARYHTARDTPDTLDYPRLAKATRGVRCAVDALGR